MVRKHWLSRSLLISFVLLFVFSLLGSTALAAPHRGVPGVTELFFSEYVEGSSYNKAVEIFNGTGSPIDLGTGVYTIEIYFNGSATPGNTIALAGTIADGDVFVVADDSANPLILAEADLAAGGNFFNGDDAVALLKNGVAVDVIGQIGADPGYYWGTGDTTTQNHTLRRADSIISGDANGADAFDPTTEWAGYPSDTFDGLGWHLSAPPATTPIYDIQFTADPSGDSPLAGTADVITEGIVTAVFYNGYFIEDPAGGAWNGLFVFDSSGPMVGDRLRLTGSISEYYGLTQLSTLTEFAVLSSGNPVPGPSVISSGDVSQEQWESVLVQVNNVTVTNDNLGYGEWSVDDGTGDVVIDDKGSYTYAPLTGDFLSAVIGPLDYSYGVFKILPRDDFDIQIAPPAYTPIYDIQFTVDPSGASPLAGTADVTTEGIVTAILYNGYFIEDPAGGPWSGLYIYDSSGPALGDHLRLTGLVKEYYGFTELASLTDFTIVSSGNPLPAPVVVPTGSVSQEQYESVLVRVEGVTVTNEALGYGEWSVNDGSGDVVLDDKGAYTYTPTNGEYLAAVIGPVDYGYGAFKILPRDDNDILFEIPLPNVVINEIDADTSGTEVDEFIELYDGGVGYTPLDGMAIVLYNGSDDKSYGDAFDLDGYTTNSEGYFVIGGTGLPTADIVVTNIYWLQNGADAVALVLGDGADFPNDTPVSTDNLIDAVVYGTNDSNDPGLLPLINAGQPQVNESANGTSWSDSSQRCPNGEGGARNTNTFAQYAPSPGEENPCGSGGVEFGFCFDPATAIHTIQGSGTDSPQVGNIAVIEGVVVGDFQNTSNQLRGFFLQEEDSEVDGDPLTSEGIFVIDYGFLDVNVGDQVRVMGTVTEYYGLTEINNVTNMEICGTATASASAVSLPVSSLTDWEQYEGMLIHIPQTLYVTGNYTQGQYGEVDLSAFARLDTPTNVVLPGTDAGALQELNDRSRIQLEDGSTLSYPATAPYMAADNTLRAGDTIPSLTGVVNYSFGYYEVHPTEAVNFTRENIRPVTPADLSGPITVASFNVLNYFSTIDYGSPVCGPAQDQDCRGADSLDEFNRQRTKIINAIIAMDADVIGLMEIENHHADAAIIDLIAGLNLTAGPGAYDYVNTGPIGDDAIKVAFIYQTDSVTTLGSPAILDGSVDPTFNDEKNRPALAQTFTHQTGEVFTAVVNHLKSKGSPCADLGDPDTGDGQGNCNLTRTSAAIAMASWLAGDPTGSSDPDFMIIGDLNSYAMEDPIAALQSNGYTNLVELFQGAGAYSYVYYGQKGYLDHALSTPELTSRVTGLDVWHINADEPTALDYNDSNQPYLYTPEIYRASDHDPVIVGICDAVPPEVTVFAEYDADWPPNHKLFDVSVTLDVLDLSGETTVSLVSVTSNEPDDNNLEEDIVIIDDYTFQLRAERLGTGDGRVYTITYQVVDSCGNVTIASVGIVIAHNVDPN
ncbi:MAG: ExeM/NucH family extracellular endonuclease [Chloroflexota bacterium]